MRKELSSKKVLAIRCPLVEPHWDRSVNLLPGCPAANNPLPEPALLFSHRISHRKEFLRNCAFDKPHHALIKNGSKP